MKKSDFIKGKLYRIDGEILQFKLYDEETNLCFEPKECTIFNIDETKNGIRAIRFRGSSAHKFTDNDIRLPLSETKQLLISEVQKALDEQDFLFILELQNMFESITIKK